MIDLTIFHDPEFQDASLDFMLDCGRLICEARNRPEFMAQAAYFSFFGEPTANDATYAAIKNAIPRADAAIGNVFLHAVSEIIAMKKGKLFRGLFLSSDEKQLLPQFQDVVVQLRLDFDRIKNRYDWNRFLEDKIAFINATR